MSFAASHSRNPDFTAALDDVCRAIETRLDGAQPDLCFVFVTHAHAAQLDELPRQLHSRLKPRILLGATGETVVGGNEEIEPHEGLAASGLSVWCAALPGADLEPFRIEFTQTPDGVMSAGFPDLSEPRTDVRAVFLLGEPYSSVPRSLLARFADELPSAAVIGGMASGAASPGENRLFYMDEAVKEGAVGVIVCGGPRIRSIVSQGCRPIAAPFVVTRAEKNVVQELGGIPPLTRLHELFSSLSSLDQHLVQKGLHLGIALNEYQEAFERGDFLISNVVGADRETGAIAIGNAVRTGQTVQFHVRDAATATEDLSQLLEKDARLHPAPPRAGLLFSCNGRGTRMFAEPNHDATAIQHSCGPIPLAGFFAQGELGPVGGRNYIHGYTASIALFE